MPDVASVIRLNPGRQRDCGSVPDRGDRLSLPVYQSEQTGSRPHPASYPMGSFPSSTAVGS
jgi:hypothetical protein